MNGFQLCWDSSFNNFHIHMEILNALAFIELRSQTEIVKKMFQTLHIYNLHIEQT